MDRMKLLGRAAAIRSFIVSFAGDTPETIRYARQALEYLPKEELQWRSTVLVTLGDAYANDGRMADAFKARSAALAAGKASGDPYLLMLVNLRLAEILRQQGDLQQVEHICERQLRSAEENGISESTIVGWLLGIWGEVLAELNNLDGAKDRATKGVELASRGRDLLYEIMSKLCLVRVLFSSGELKGAEVVIQSVENTSLDHDMPSWALVQLSTWRARIWLALGKTEAASQWAEDCQLASDEEPSFLNEMELMAYARILIAQRRLDEATRLLERLLAAAETGGRISRVIEIGILQALALQAQGEAGRALDALESAFALAEPKGFVRTFVDEGPMMARLLQGARNRGISADYAGRLLAAFPPEDPLPPGQASAPPDQTGLVETLSERELEVLQLIAKGFTNREIADRLFLSLHTVKVHARNIYGKLGVGNRTQAVARARDLGVLPHS
jgi:LuxR family maltose regulon positive regulatory protein